MTSKLWDVINEGGEGYRPTTHVRERIEIESDLAGAESKLARREDEARYHNYSFESRGLVDLQRKRVEALRAELARL